MRKGADMMPLQTLFENPSSRKSSFVNHAQKNASDDNCTSINHAKGIGDEVNCCSVSSEKNKFLLLLETIFTLVLLVWTELVSIADPSHG